MRHRHDACLIRPERSLNLQEILHGALDGPDAARYERLLAKEKMTSEQARAARRHWHAAAKVAMMTRRGTFMAVARRQSQGMDMLLTSNRPMGGREVLPPLQSAPARSASPGPGMLASFPSRQQSA